MAPANRRPHADKSSRHADPGPPPKKARKEASQLKPKPSKPASGALTPSRERKQDPQPSLLHNEDKAFPRGGTSVLTPLEHKQIQIEAEQDVLFENSGQKQHTEDDDILDRSGLGQKDEDGITPKRPSKKRKRSHPAGIAAAVAVLEDVVKIESLSFRKLVPGSLVLGQVARITSHDVALTLPNNLTGYIPLTSVSDKLNQRIETILALSDEEEQDEADKGDEINLQDVFRVGQYLRAYVTSNYDEHLSQGLAKSRRRIELTVNPRQTNVEVETSDITTGSTVQAAVISTEDRGFVMDLGLKNQSLKGFVPVQELDPEVDPSTVKEGTVWLCLVTGISTNKKTIQLSAKQQRIGDVQKANYISDTPKLNTLLPGTAVQMLVISSSPAGICGKIAGFVDATADWIHSGTNGQTKVPKVGSKAKARILCIFPENENKVVVSLLGHTLSLSNTIAKADGEAQSPLEMLSISAIVEAAVVIKIFAKLGLVLDLGNGLHGFAHLSKLSDDRVESLSETSGPYKLGSVHRARVLGYNSIDGQFNLSLEKKVIEQPFLRLEDIQVGQLVKGSVEKLLIKADGMVGLLVNLADGISALVPEMHLADVKLQHPERKFKEGLQVSARVLSIDLERRFIKLTLKKTLVNSSEIWVDYKQISVGSQSAGTLQSLSQSGAVVQFFGNVRGFLPVSEMSEAYIRDAQDHFHVGQIVNVNVRSIDPHHNRMTVSCRDPSQETGEKLADEDELGTGTLVGATVTEKTDLHFTMELTGSGRAAILRIGHLSDGTEHKDRSTWERIQVGQKLQDLLVLDKSSKRKLVLLSKKPSLLKGARAGHLLSTFQHVRLNENTEGFVRNITAEAVFIEFANGLVGLLPKQHLTDEMAEMPNFGLRMDQSLKVRIHNIDYQQQRFTVSMKREQHNNSNNNSGDADASKGGATEGEVTNPVDGRSMSAADFTLGARTQARITSVKDTQLNVQLADKIQGRVDISEVFDNWEDIQDKKKPLATFRKNQIIAVKIIGIHNSRTHRFLPISHRQGGNPVFELTAKSASQLSDQADVLTLDKLSPGASVIAFVNNVIDNHIWATVSPSVNGRIDILDISDDVSVLKDLASNFPPGAAIKTRVKSVDLPGSRLDLIAIPNRNEEGLTMSHVSEGMILPGQVGKVSESALVVRLSASVVGTVGMTQLADDYSQANPAAHHRNEIVRVCILQVDTINQKITLSTRPSKVLSSSLPVADPHIATVSQLKVNDVLRGFVKHISDKGIFVRLGPSVTAFVRVSDLSDAFLKDWKAAFKLDQLVRGKVTAVTEKLDYVQMTLKASMLDKDYVEPINFEDLNVGQIVTGRIRKVEDFGAFIHVDNSRNVSGLCHRSEVAENRVEDVRKLYEEGDAVKAIILKVDPEKRRVNFGLKASYFQKEAENDEGPSLTDEEDLEDESGVRLDRTIYRGDLDLELDTTGFDDESNDDEGEHSDDAMEVDDDAMEDDVIPKNSVTEGLSTIGFDWDGTAVDGLALGKENTFSGCDENERAQSRERKTKDSNIDRTGNLDRYGPQSAEDFERQLLGQPNSSALWTQYMANQLQLGGANRAREIAERALNTINMREEEDKANIWISLMNLENEFGDDDTLESVFKRACQYSDNQKMHEKLVSIFIDSAKHQKADELFQAMMRNKAFSKHTAMWLNYATFLMTSIKEPNRARALLTRASQSVPPHLHRYLITRFAALEFTSPHGEPERGRTILEGLLSTFPTERDLWDQFIDLEQSKGDLENARSLFHRMTGEGTRMRAKQVRSIFERWEKFEKRNGTAKQMEYVTKKKEQFETRHRRDHGKDE